MHDDPTIYHWLMLALGLWSLTVSAAGLYVLVRVAWPVVADAYRSWRTRREVRRLMEWNRSNP